MKINKKGFTLVELLAVIVVLAIIMIIAVPSVVENMNKAKESSFKVYSQKVLSSATSIFMSDQMLNPAITSKCYVIETELGLTTAGRYTGWVVAEFDQTAGSYVYKIYMTDKQFVVKGANVDEVAGGFFIDATTGKNTANPVIVKGTAVTKPVDPAGKYTCK